MSILKQFVRVCALVLGVGFGGMVWADVAPVTTSVMAPVAVNLADAETLAAGLAGVGPSKAERIISFREQHGPFLSPEELTQVKGIGASTVAKNADRLSFVTE